MKFKSVDIFPTTLLTINIGSDSTNEILTEVKGKKKQIVDNGYTSENYTTDYKNNIKIDSFEFVANHIKNKFHNNNIKFVLNDYWVAIYNSFGYHATHTHKFGIMHDQNYSAILYLTGGAPTRFFSNNPSSYNNETEIDINPGDIIFFPSNLPHSYPPNKQENERYVIPFNCSLYEY